MDIDFPYSPLSSSPDPLWSNPKRHNGVTARHDSVERVLGNATTLRMIMGFLECEFPLEDFVVNTAYKLNFVARYRPTEVCWNWYANWFPNDLSERPLSLSFTSCDEVRTTCFPNNLWDRLHALCRNLRLTPLEVAHLPYGGIDEASSPLEGVQTGLFANLHTIYLNDDDDVMSGTPWLQRYTKGGGQLTAQLLTHLQHFPNVRKLNIFVNTNQQVQLLSQLTQLEVLKLDVEDVTDDEAFLSPLRTLTRLRYLNLQHNASCDDFSSFLPYLCNLEVLAMNWSGLGSIQRLTSLRRYSLEYFGARDDVVRNLLSLPQSDVDIHLPISSVVVLKTDKTPKQRQTYCEELRKLMRRFGLGFRTSQCANIRGYASLITFALRRWPALPGDVTDPDVVDQYVLRLCGYGVTCSRCLEQGWHHDCVHCLSCDLRPYVPDPPAAWERRVRPRLTV